MFDIKSILFYNTVLCICAVLSYKPLIGRYNLILAFIFIALLSGFRYDIGNDYQIQAEIWDNLADSFQFEHSIEDIRLLLLTEEPATLLFTYLFHWAKRPSAYIFFIYSAITCFFIYKTVKRENSGTSAIFIFFTMCLIFQLWDWSRQAVAMSVVLYAYRYLEQSKLTKYILSIIIASCFHTSAIVMLLLYPIRNVDINKNIAIVIIAILVILAYTGILSYISQNILNFTSTQFSFYQNYTDSEYITQNDSMLSASAILFTTIIASIQIYTLPKGSTMLRLILFLGTVLYVCAVGNLLIERIARYLLLVQLVTFQYVFRLRYPSIKIVIILLMLFHYNYAITYVGATRGAVPYDSIFSNNFKQENYRYRNFITP